MPAEPTDPLDPHRTATLRKAVLDTWASSAGRFREDANAEELLARGYADRVLVELAANAVDAAQQARVRAVLAIEQVQLSDGTAELRIANTGASLTADGVRALASLRASAKRDTASTIGHFGVGFTAVRAISDAPALLSTSGSVQFSAVRTAEAVAALGNSALDAELGRRDGVIPALRLCWPLATGRTDDSDDTDSSESTQGTGPAVPQGFSSQVRLPLRAGIDADEVLASWLQTACDDLWWSLPALDEIRFPGLAIQRERGVPSAGSSAGSSAGVQVCREQLIELRPGHPPVRRNFRTAESRGALPPALLADRPVEERERSDWRLCWSLPIPSDDSEEFAEPAPFDPFAGPTSAAHAIGAPTPTDDQLTLPARLIGTFPVDETRRRITPGALSDHLLDRSVDAYTALVLSQPADDRWELVPPQEFPAGDLDARLRALLLDRLSSTPLLVGVLGEPIGPSAAVNCPDLDDHTAAAVAEAIPTLTSVPIAARSAARALGVTAIDLSQAVDALGVLVRPPRWWAQVYRGLAGADTESLVGLPVPLADGRQVIGARGVLLPTPSMQELVASISAVLPAVRFVASDALEDAQVRELLVRIGALDADPDAILRSAALQAEIDALAGDFEAEQLDEITLPPRARRSGEPAGEELSDSAVPGEPDAGAVAALVLDLIAAGGTPEPSLLSDLLLGTQDGEPWPAAELLLPDSTLRPILDPDALPVIGAQWVQRWGPTVLERAGVRAGPLVLALDDPRAEKLLPDLEIFLDEQLTDGRSDGARGIADLDLVQDWPGLLILLDNDPVARAAVLARPGERSYTGWWIADHALIDDRPPERHRVDAVLPRSAALQLLPPVSIGLTAEFAAAVGVLATDDQFFTLLDDDPQTVLELFCDASRSLEPAAVVAIAGQLVARLAQDDSVELPDTVRVCDGSVVPADTALVPDGPWWSQVLPPSRLLATRADPLTASEVFGLPLATAAAALLVPIGMTPGPLQPAVAALLGPDHRRPRVAERLTIRDPDGVEHRVGWWPAAGGPVCDGSDLATAQALAWGNGRWAERHEILAALRGDAAAELVAQVWD